MSLASNLRNSVSFSPASLFAGGEQGVWYDPSDLSTVFQDAAGTTPVTASGQPVGLMLDKSKGLARGPELVPDDLTTTFSSSSHIISSPTALTASSAQAEQINSGALVESGKAYRVSFTLSSYTSTGGGGVNVRVGSASSNDFAVNANGTYERTVVADGGSLVFRPNGAEVQSWVITNISVRELRGNHATQTTASKRPTYTEGGGLSWLAFDGADDAMQTAAIDFTVTDKMSVFTGVRKLSDTQINVLYELSASAAINGGSFWALPSYTGATPNTNAVWHILTRGTAFKNATTPTTFPAPHTAVQTHLSDISGDRTTLRINGVQEVQNTGDLGSGSFGNYPLFIGARNNTSLFFEGNLYGMIVVGKTTTAPETASAEAYMAGKTGLTL